MIITDSGIIIKLPLDQVSTLKRATQGVRLINLKEEQKVSTVALVAREDDSEENTENIMEEVSSTEEEQVNE
jgi:DNA gyrase subunit A